MVADLINTVPEAIHNMYELQMVVQISFVRIRWLRLRSYENMFEEIDDFLKDAAVKVFLRNKNVTVQFTSEQSDAALNGTYETNVF